MSDEDRTTYNGRYEVQRRVARGGMADVFLARDLLLARPVAVKVLFPEFASDPSFVARFRREAQAAANLNHPNIVGVYDWGQEAGTYYIVMEFIDGRSLSEILRTQGTPPAKTAAGIAADVAAALGFAHHNGVVHRDIKPGNIMITNSGHVKVADFGIARAITASAEENLTQTGSVMGTATYFSPEQAQGHNVEGRSDLYSLGIVMYEMAHGRPPFTADSPIAVAYKHVQERPPSLREAHPEVPPAYEAIVMRLLAKSPDDRYPDADALRSDLRRFAEGRRVKAVAAAGAGAVAGAAAGAALARTGGPKPVEPGDPTRSAAAVQADVTPAPPEPEVLEATDDDTPIEQAHRSRTGWFVLVLLLALATIGGLLYLFAETLGIGDTETLEVPTVVGQPEATARQVLEAEGLVVPANSERQTSDEIPAGAVISQDPEPGTEVERGTTVTLIVSSGAPPQETIPMPNLVGMDFDEAVAELLDRGFARADIAAPRVVPSDAPEDEVLTQSPRAGTDVAEGTTIQLTVSSGVPATTEPPPTQPPTTSPPATEPPETEPPETEPPTTEPPTTEPPETEPPTTESSTSSSSSSSSVPA